MCFFTPHDKSIDNGIGSNQIPVTNIVTEMVVLSILTYISTEFFFVAKCLSFPYIFFNILLSSLK